MKDLSLPGVKENQLTSLKENLKNKNTARCPVDTIQSRSIPLISLH